MSDWSSDVCSSVYLGISRGDKARHILRDQALRKLYADDPEIAPGTFGGAVPTGWEQIDSRFEGYSLRQKDKVIFHKLVRRDVKRPVARGTRSEERGVGKECVTACRARCSRHLQKKKTHTKSPNTTPHT